MLNTTLDRTSYSALVALSQGAPAVVPPSVDVRTVLEGAKGALASVDELLKTIGQELGEILGRVFGGLAKGALDALSQTVLDLVHNLAAEAQQLVGQATEKLKGVIDHTIDRLETFSANLLHSVQRTVSIVHAMVERLMNLANQRILELVFEAGIQAYAVVYALPFRAPRTRLVYVTPFEYRPNFFAAQTVIVHGNFLSAARDWFIGDRKVVPFSSTDERVVLPIDSLDGLGKHEILTTVSATAVFGRWRGHVDKVGSLPLCISENLEFALSVRVQPVLHVRSRHTEGHKFDFSTGGGGFGSGEKYRKDVYGPSRPQAQVVGVTEQNLQINLARRNCYIDRSANCVVYEAWLNSAGAFGPGRWVTVDVCVEDEMIVQEPGTAAEFRVDSLDETKPRIEYTSPSYPGADALLARTDLVSLSWIVDVRILKTPANGTTITTPLHLEGTPGNPPEYSDGSLAIKVDSVSGAVTVVLAQRD